MQACFNYYAILDWEYLPCTMTCEIDGVFLDIVLYYQPIFLPKLLRADTCPHEVNQWLIDGGWDVGAVWVLHLQGSEKLIFCFLFWMDQSLLLHDLTLTPFYKISTGFVLWELDWAASLFKRTMLVILIIGDATVTKVSRRWVLRDGTRCIFLWSCTSIAVLTAKLSSEDYMKHRWWVDGRITHFKQHLYY